MSGTSLDGIDVALIETDAESVTRFGPSATRAYGDDEQRVLRQALAEARTLRDRTLRPGILAQAEALVTKLHAGAVRDLLAANAVDPASIDVVGFHGQTVLHRPAAHLTVQIGDGRVLAAELDLPVVYDFRAADVAAGGQGAPLVPIYHQALARALDRPHPIAVLNVGGVANVTYIDGSDPIAGDTGPGNALLDDFMRARTGARFDREGIEAARGRPDQAFIARVLDHPFFAAPCPKSLDRNDFALSALGLPDLPVADGAATLCGLTAAAVARVVPLLPRRPASWIVAGGGARNRTMLAMLGDALAPAKVETADDVGWSADALEAQAFAYMAARAVRGLPITFPTTTGVPRPMTGGILVQPVG